MATDAVLGEQRLNLFRIPYGIGRSCIIRGDEVRGDRHDERHTKQRSAE